MEISFFKIIDLITINVAAFFCVCSHVAFSMELENTKENEPSIEVSDDAFKHILFGEKTENKFSGGHDFGNYKNAGYTKNQTAFFDCKNNVYIVSSTKGLSLPSLIKELSKGHFVKFHTLFPPKVVSKDFIIGAFKKAIKENTVEDEKELFYTEYDGFYVCGYFTKNKESYSITSIWPDLSWHLRREFFKNANEFEIKRFLKLSETGEWIRQGFSIDEFDNIKVIKGYNENDLYIPKKIRDILNSKKDSIKLNSNEFYTTDLLKEFFDKKIRETSEFENLSIFDFFFEDTKAPEKSEIDLLIRYMKEFVPGFKYSPKKVGNKDNNNTNVFTAYKLEASKFLKGSKDGLPTIKKLEVDYNDENKIKIKKVVVGSTITIVDNKRREMVGLKFGEELLFELLYLNFLENYKEFGWKMSKDVSEKSLEIRRIAAKIFYKNFIAKLLPKSLAKELVDAGFDVRLRYATNLNKNINSEKKNTELYVLEVLSRKDLSVEKLSFSDKTSALVTVNGSHSCPFFITFSAI